jgi:predicted ATP-grasp superfamily ATP-dependent carboligase
LRGLFGVDTILSSQGKLFPIELNPRYTASIEVLERSLGISTIAMHIEICRRGTLPEWSFIGSDCEHTCGKAIVYAREQITVSPAFFEWCLGQNEGHEWPVIADIPSPETMIEIGQPIVTVLTDGRCTESVRQRLQRLAAEVFARSHLAPRDGETL